MKLLYQLICFVISLAFIISLQDKKDIKIIGLLEESSCSEDKTTFSFSIKAEFEDIDENSNFTITMLSPNYVNSTCIFNEENITCEIDTIQFPLPKEIHLPKSLSDKNFTFIEWESTIGENNIIKIEGGCQADYNYTFSPINYFTRCSRDKKNFLTIHGNLRIKNSAPSLNITTDEGKDFEIPVILDNSADTTECTIYKLAKDVYKENSKIVCVLEGKKSIKIYKTLTDLKEEDNGNKGKEGEKEKEKEKEEDKDSGEKKEEESDDGIYMMIQPTKELEILECYSNLFKLNIIFIFLIILL